MFSVMSLIIIATNAYAHTKNFYIRTIKSLSGISTTAFLNSVLKVIDYSFGLIALYMENESGVLPFLQIIEKEFETE